MFLISRRKQIFLIKFCIDIYTYKNASTSQSFSYRTKSLNISEKDILAVIKSIDPTRQLINQNVQVSNKEITIPMKSIFEQWLKHEKIPEIWKVANVVCVHQKEDKILQKKISSIFVRFFERILYHCTKNQVFY